ncbi:MAG: type II toxin-antitoxin system HicA family toxin [Elusimicrobiales bacterium]|nr:type II toxin-antitoxin system HicA family toxin [Elusimicrobiales bacterium]
MGRIPIISSKKMEKVLLFIGFEKIRQKGSHVFYSHKDGRYTTLPHHKGRDLAKPLILQVLKEIGLTVDEFLYILKKV